MILIHTITFSPGGFLISSLALSAGRSFRPDYKAVIIGSYLYFTYSCLHCRRFDSVYN